MRVKERVRQGRRESVLRVKDKRGQRDGMRVKDKRGERVCIENERQESMRGK